MLIILRKKYNKGLILGLAQPFKKERSTDDHDVTSRKSIKNWEPNQKVVMF